MNIIIVDLFEALLRKNCYGRESQLRIVRACLSKREKMAVRNPAPAYSESFLTDNTPEGFISPFQNTHGKNQNKFVVTNCYRKTENAALDNCTAVNERIDDLQNQVENVSLNNAQLVHEVESLKIENAELHLATQHLFIKQMAKIREPSQDNSKAMVKRRPKTIERRKAHLKMLRRETKKILKF